MFSALPQTAENHVFQLFVTGLKGLPSGSPFLCAEFAEIMGP
jgi:hypothetical protein